MPSSSAASKASRSVTTNVAPIALLGDDPALGRGFVVLADEGIAARLEGPDPDLHRLAAGDDLLDPQLLALELLGRGVLVGDHEHEGRPRLHADLVRLETVLLDGHGDLDVGPGGHGRGQDETGREQEKKRATRSHRWASGRMKVYTTSGIRVT